MIIQKMEYIITKTRMKKRIKKLIKQEWIYKNTDLKGINYYPNKEVRVKQNKEFD